MKSIIFVIHGIAGGGAERVASLLINEWVRLKYNVLLITFSPLEENDYFISPLVSRRFIINNYNFNFFFISKIISNIARVFKLRKIIRREKNSVVISFITRTNIEVIIATLGLGNKIIISERNHVYSQRNHWSRFERFMRIVFYRFSSKVTSNILSSLKYMEKYVPREKLVFIPNPVTIQKVVSTIDSNIILTVGRLVYQKNHRELITAISKIKIQTKGWSVNILGDGPLRDDLEQHIISHNLSDMVTLHHTVSDINPYYFSAGIFVLTSHYEGMPNVLFEAMAHKIPCIVPNNLSGALYFVEDNVTGLIYKAGDTTDLANKINMLIDDNDLRIHIGNMSYKKLNHLTIDKIINRWS